MCIESAHESHNKYCMNCIVSQNLKFIATVINWIERERGGEGERENRLEKSWLDSTLP